MFIIRSNVHTKQIIYSYIINNTELKRRFYLKFNDLKFCYYDYLTSFKRYGKKSYNFYSNINTVAPHENEMFVFLL